MKSGIRVLYAQIEKAETVSAFFLSEGIPLFASLVSRGKRKWGSGTEFSQIVAKSSVIIFFVLNRAYNLTAAGLKTGETVMGSGIPSGKVPFGGALGATPPLA